MKSDFYNLVFDWKRIYLKRTIAKYLRLIFYGEDLIISEATCARVITNDCDERSETEEDLLVNEVNEPRGEEEKSARARILRDGGR